MIKKPNLFYPTLADFLRNKISASKQNDSFRRGSLDAPIEQGEPDIMWQSVVYIKETNQIWTHGALFGPNSDHHSDNDLAIERAERIAGDEVNIQKMSELEQKHDEQMQDLSDKVDKHFSAIEFDDEDGDIVLITNDVSAVTGGSMDDDGNVILDLTF